MKKVVLICVVLLAVCASSIFTRTTSYAEGTPDATQVTGQEVKIKAADDLDIVGLFYPVTSGTAPAILLLHDGVSTKAQWLRYIPSFTQTGYNVLVIDQRGKGETKLGSATGNLYDLQDKDVPVVMTWLRQQPTVDSAAVAIIGARLGANFALRTCAADALCHTVIALTPSTDFFGIKTEDSMKAMTKDKNVFLVATQYGEAGAVSMKALEAAAPPNINLMTRLYGGGISLGPGMFDSDPNLMPMVLLWLKTYNQPHAQ